MGKLGLRSPRSRRRLSYSMSRSWYLHLLNMCGKQCEQAATSRTHQGPEEASWHQISRRIQRWRTSKPSKPKRLWLQQTPASFAVSRPPKATLRIFNIQLTRNISQFRPKNLHLVSTRRSKAVRCRSFTDSICSDRKLAQVPNRVSQSTSKSSLRIQLETPSSFSQDQTPASRLASASSWCCFAR